MYKNIVLAAVALFAVSCNMVYEYGNCPSFSEPREVSFCIAISSSEGATRAGWDEVAATDEVGQPFENKILPETLRVSVYGADNSYIGNVENLIYWPINETTYQFNGVLPEAFMSNFESATDKSYKFMVYANCGDGQNADLVYSYDDLDPTTGAIPMWGVRQVDMSGLLENSVKSLGTISLLRAVAKVEVVVDDVLAAECTLEGATINYHNRTGYVLPTGWNSVAATEELDRDGCIRPYRSLHTSPHSLTEQTEGKSFVIYLPEYDNHLFADYEAKVSVNILYNGTHMSFEDALQFKRYVNGYATGESSNIVRNTIYRFRITKVNAGGLELDYEVADWHRSDDWQWEQNFDYPNYHNPVLPDTAVRDGDSTNDIFPEQPVMMYAAGSGNTQNYIYDETGAFSCWFQLTSPAGLMWMPTLRDAANLCVIRVYKETPGMPLELVYTTELDQMDATLKSGEKLLAYSGWYNIKIIPTDASYTGITRFGITYSQDWMGVGSRYLLINGEVDHIIWPNSGTEPRIINIQQVTN